MEWLATEGPVNQKATVGLSRMMTQVTSTVSESQRQLMVSFMRYLISTGQDNIHRDECRILDSTFDVAPAAVWSHLERERADPSVFVRHYADIIPSVTNLADVEILMACGSIWASVQPELKRAAATSQLGDRLFGLPCRTS